MKLNRRKFLGQAGGWTLGGLLASYMRAVTPNRLVGRKSKSIDENLDELQKLKAMLERKEPNIWLFTGDSITHGAKHTHGYRSYPEVFQERIRWEIDAIPILHTPNPIILDKSPERRTLPKYIPVLRELADQEKIVLVDNYRHWEQTGKERSMDYVFTNWLNDPLHPNQYGHQEIARLMFKTLDFYDPAAATCGGPYYEGEH